MFFFLQKTSIILLKFIKTLMINRYSLNKFKCLSDGTHNYSIVIQKYQTIFNNNNLIIITKIK